MMKSHMGAMSGAGMGGAMMMHGKALHVRLRPQNGSGETGSAVLTQVGSGVRVMLTVNHAPATVPQPAHIHMGSCATLNPAPEYPLKPVVGGTSLTTIPGVKLASLIKSPHAINVHKSAKALKTYVACGNVLGTKAAMSPMK